MKVWLCENPIGVEALNWRELPDPTPSPTEVFIKIQAASLNFPDLLIVRIIIVDKIDLNLSND